MTYNSINPAAVAELSKAKTINEWNEIYKRIEPVYGTRALAAIDASGLITTVLGTDARRPRRNF